MEKDKIEKNLIPDDKITDEKSKMVMSANIFSSGSTFFKSKEDIFESIKSEGFTPRVEWEDTSEIEGEIFTHMEVGLVCLHGNAECSRTYDKHEDGTWEHVEDSFGFPCPNCIS